MAGHILSYGKTNFFNSNEKIERGKYINIQLYILYFDRLLKWYDVVHIP